MCKRKWRGMELYWEATAVWVRKKRKGSGVPTSPSHVTLASAFGRAGLLLVCGSFLLLTAAHGCPLALPIGALKFVHLLP